MLQVTPFIIGGKRHILWHCFVFITFFIMLFFLTSCGTSMSERNLTNLKRLEKGMTKQQVLKIMGDPLLGEVYNTPDVWYYFTESKWSDGACTRDECTPLFFNRGLLLGWGQDAYKKYRQKKW
jgi:outer membrane protein assembly factor BamE (lipoprotein component of BamABCDE complex)